MPGEDRIKAAASEAGFGPEDEWASVTALEIEYGLLKKDPVQRRRCLLCLRAPLPYDRMPPDRAAIYSDRHETTTLTPRNAPSGSSSSRRRSTATRNWPRTGSPTALTGTIKPSARAMKAPTACRPGAERWHGDSGG